MCALSPPVLHLDAQAYTKNSRAMLPLTISGRVHKIRHQFHVLVVLVNVYVHLHVNLEVY